MTRAKQQAAVVNDAPAAPQEYLGKIARVPWLPIVGVVFVVFAFYAAQFVSGILVSIYPWTQHWTNTQANDWLQNSVLAQFSFILVAEVVTIGAVYWFLKRYGKSLRFIGLKRPCWRDLGYALLGVIVYGIVLYLIIIPLVAHLFHSFNVNQHQEIGFSSVHGALQLTLTYVSLAVLPPLAEEILVRGLLYSSLRSWVPRLVAVLATSLIFGAAHFNAGGYIAALDTFILSIVLIGLREKTGSLWASITVHSIKNSIAFILLFVVAAH